MNDALIRLASQQLPFDSLINSGGCIAPKKTEVVRVKKNVSRKAD